MTLGNVVHYFMTHHEYNFYPERTYSQSLRISGAQIFSDFVFIIRRLLKQLPWFKIVKLTPMKF